MSQSQFVKYPQTLPFHQFLKSLYLLPDPIRPSGGTFLGSVKLHGSNTTIVFRPTQYPTKPSIQIQSRNRILTATSDNQGVFAFLDRKPLHVLLEKILVVHGGKQKDVSYKEIIVAGEWAGGNVQRGVALNQLPFFFAIFNICVDGLWVSDMRNYRNVALPKQNVFNVFGVGPTYEITISSFYDEKEVEGALRYANQLTRAVGEEDPFAKSVSEFLLPEGKVAKGEGEGIVWILLDPPEGNLLNFKTKTEKFSTVNVKLEKAHKDAGVVEKAQAFVDYACPLDGRRLVQGTEYISEMNGVNVEGLDMKYTGQFIKWVIQDTLKEEADELARFGADKKEVVRLLSDRARAWFREQT